MHCNGWESNVNHQQIENVQPYIYLGLPVPKPNDRKHFQSATFDRELVVF